MSSRVEEHQDHTKQSVFNHGLIKLVISTVLHKREKTWEYFLFWFRNREGRVVLEESVRQRSEFDQET